MEYQGETSYGRIHGVSERHSSRKKIHHDSISANSIFGFLALQEVIIVQCSPLVILDHPNYVLMLTQLNFRSDGERFATGGSDHAVRVYDEETHKEVIRWGGKDTLEQGTHSSQVFCVKWLKHEPNKLVR